MQSHYSCKDFSVSFMLIVLFFHSFIWAGNNCQAIHFCFHLSALCTVDVHWLAPRQALALEQLLFLGSPPWPWGPVCVWDSQHFSMISQAPVWELRPTLTFSRLGNGDSAPHHAWILLLGNNLAKDKRLTWVIITFPLLITSHRHWSS